MTSHPALANSPGKTRGRALARYKEMMEMTDLPGENDEDGEEYANDGGADEKTEVYEDDDTRDDAEA